SHRDHMNALGLRAANTSRCRVRYPLSGRQGDRQVAGGLACFGDTAAETATVCSSCSSTIVTSNRSRSELERDLLERRRSIDSIPSDAGPRNQLHSTDPCAPYLHRILFPLQGLEARHRLADGP